MNLEVVPQIYDGTGQASDACPPVSLLRDLGVLSATERLLSGRLVTTLRGGESYNMVYHLGVYNPETGRSSARMLREKCIVSMGAMIGKAIAEFWRNQDLARRGIAVPYAYGVVDASIYMDYIPTDRAAEVLRAIRLSPETDESQAALAQLIAIAIKLDRAGYRPRDYIRDLLYDGDQERFVYGDTGEDLGDPDPVNKSNVSTLHLLGRFPGLRDLIQEKSQS
ncbi:hypothetical protein HYW42_05300 [Candidatus Daviesbacteria bacterium]|nr:hypothetical protein [Candidatus Daviesbacteria bacterium]